MGSADNHLQGVVARSACDAWAVGYYYNGSSQRTLIEHWNGKAWTVKQSPSRGGAANVNYLYGVVATSPTNAWAVGYYYNGSSQRTLIEHWNGNAWKLQQSPNRGGPAAYNELFGVTATSSTNAWAVGQYFNGTTYRTLILHWNGTAWKAARSPNPGVSPNGNTLDAVTASSSHDVWAVGDYANGLGANRTLILHWNGKAWKLRKSPNPSANYNFLKGVAAVSSTNAWAVGYRGTNYRTLILHWNGKAWRAKQSPNRGGSTDNNQLWGVAATSATGAWAAGYYWNGSAYRTLIERWNGTAWKLQQSPNRGTSTSYNELFGVAASSSSDAWAVGNYQTPTARTLIERWNGAAWKG